MSERLLSIDAFADTIKQRLRNRADCLMIITGLPGTGKSTFAIELSRRVDDEFGIKRNVIFDPDVKKIIQKITKDLPAYAAAILDEAIRAANKRRWMDSLNVFLIEYLALCRKDYKLIALCLPSIRQLDSGIVNDRAVYWVDIVKRGVAVVFSRKKHSSAEDPFGLKRNLIDKAIMKMYPGRGALELTDKELVRAYSSIKDHYVCTIYFDAMSAELEEEYEMTAAEMRKDLKPPEEWGSRAKLTKMRLNKLVAHSYVNHEETQQSIAAVMGCEQAYVSFCLKEEGVQRTDKK